jgi:hypothetical protein
MAAVEVVTGLAVLVCPAMGARLLIGADAGGMGISIIRLTGIALIGLGVACWPRRSATGAIDGMLAYGSLATIYLAVLGFTGEWTGKFLWPAVGLHAVLTILLVWMRIKKRLDD